MIHISIKAESIFSIFGFQVTNSLLTATLAVFLFLFIALYYQQQISLKESRRSGFFYFLHYVNVTLYNFFNLILNEKTDVLFSLVASFFIYIIVQNWFGLIPGVGSVLVGESPLLRGADADLNTTLSLALISVIFTQIYAIKELGFATYIKKFINLTNPIVFFTGFLEIISELSKIISFSFRLFGNIFAGEVLLAIVSFLIPILASFPFLAYEVFVGFIQALVFAALTAIFISIAIQPHES